MLDLMRQATRKTPNMKVLMPPHITGLIAREATFRGLSANCIGKEPRTSLADGWMFMPLDVENFEALLGSHPTPTMGKFEYLTFNLLDAMKAWSAAGDLCYIKTDYHGGSGGQGAVVIKGGNIAFGPMNAFEGVINAALAILGMLATPPSLDAFEALGFTKYRTNEDFRLQAFNP